MGYSFFTKCAQPHLVYLVSLWNNGQNWWTHLFEFTALTVQSNKNKVWRVEEEAKLSDPESLRLLMHPNSAAPSVSHQCMWKFHLRMTQQG